MHLQESSWIHHSALHIASAADFFQITSFAIAVIPAICILRTACQLTNWIGMQPVSKSAASADHSLRFLIFDGSRLIDCQLSRSLPWISRAWLLWSYDQYFLNISVSLNSIIDLLSFCTSWNSTYSLLQIKSLTSSRESYCLGQAHDWVITWILMISAIAAYHS